ncbi:LysR family transcriptional regulator ArgP [Aestuariibius sp. HNIBRBA575]|uniref:LysR family transcriptional regulator ArgP n=1 Tax=Aestuariibius sp. HNIBRBA575 TaxID=3233343 RepID=UPI0034A4F24C
MHLDPAQLSALAAVLRHGSFDAAARVLNVTPPAISQRIKALEDQVGTPLVRRSTPCQATDKGKILARYADDLALLQSGVLSQLNITGRPVNLRIAVNADSLATWFISALTATDLLYELEIDDQDHSADWLRTGEVCAAITSRSQPVQGCDVVPLGTLEYLAVASPAFVARYFANGITPQALQSAPMITFSPKDRLQRDWASHLAGRPIQPPTHLIPSSQAFVHASLAGIGWGMNPTRLVMDHIKRGDLVILGDGTTLPTPLYWQTTRHMKSVLAPLTRAVIKSAKSALRPL